MKLEIGTRVRAAEGAFFYDEGDEGTVIEFLDSNIVWVQFDGHKCSDGFWAAPIESLEVIE